MRRASAARHCTARHGTARHGDDLTHDQLREPLAVTRAAERFTSEDESAARVHLVAYGRARERDEPRAARVAHAAFHFTLYAASGSEWLVRLIRPAWENCERYRAMSLQRRSGLEVEREHELILDPCVRHEPERAASHAA